MHASKFRFESEEQPLECYQLWLDFKAQMDVKLEEFIASQVAGLTPDMIMESLLRLNQQDGGLLSCLDYLMAAADYTDFVNLMLDFREGFESELPEQDECFQQLAGSPTGQAGTASDEGG